MSLKLIVAMVKDELTDSAVEAARKVGATGATIISSVRGEGLTPEKSFFGLSLTGQRDVILFVVAAPIARDILEQIALDCDLDNNSGAGVAFQVDIEDAIGLKTQMSTILGEIEEKL